MDLLKSELHVASLVLAIRLTVGQGVPIHRDRPTHGLVFVNACTSRFSFDGRELVCHSGEVLYLPKGSNYTVHTENDSSDCLGEVFAINFLTLEEKAENRPAVLKLKNPERLRGLFARTVKSWNQKSVGYYEECMSLLYEIVRQLRVEQAAYAPLEKTRMTLAPALSYIHGHYTSEVIGAGELAALCGVSEPYLRRLFHAVFGVSPIAYVNGLRIRYAKELLSAREYSVTEVASLSGFRDVSYFSREFKKATGVSPVKYV